MERERELVKSLLNLIDICDDFCIYVWFEIFISTGMKRFFSMFLFTFYIVKYWLFRTIDAILFAQ